MLLESYPFDVKYIDGNAIKTLPENLQNLHRQLVLIGQKSNNRGGSDPQSQEDLLQVVRVMDRKLTALFTRSNQLESQLAAQSKDGGKKQDQSEGFKELSE